MDSVCPLRLTQRCSIPWRRLSRRKPFVLRDRIQPLTARRRAAATRQRIAATPWAIASFPCLFVPRVSSPSSICRVALMTTRRLARCSHLAPPASDGHEGCPDDQQDGSPEKPRIESRPTAPRRDLGDLRLRLDERVPRS